MCAAHYKIDPVELKMTALYKNPFRDYRVPSTLLLQIHCKKTHVHSACFVFFPPLLTFLEPVQCPPTARHRSGKPSFYLLPALSRLSQALHLFLRSLRKTFLSRVDYLSCVVSNPLITCLDLWRVVGSLQQVVSYPQRTAPRLPSLPSLARLVLGWFGAGAATVLPVAAIAAAGSCCTLPFLTTVVAAAPPVAIRLPAWPGGHAGASLGSFRARLGSHLRDSSRSLLPALCSGTCVCGPTEHGRGFRVSLLLPRRPLHVRGRHPRCSSLFGLSGLSFLASGSSYRGFSGA